ncbi:hypothetical protein [Sedimentibacter sp. MB31-C6]|uniref:hypothetical protein n=1 Tax=Sedimentibacter sp. MB31-C6 TaxID=3109366 RepID=UPI002DDDA902|nr:hypothetical protein [Sedimentibacter sp. MB36-C1]WSI03235.1 hypothetical protein U8307_09280 [Sedimentibacter sp. MB36-C1]
MSKHDNYCNICDRLLRDYEGRYVFIKFICPTYFGTAGRILDIRDNLVILEYIYGGISVTCCDNICYVIPIEVSNNTD